MGRHSHQFTHRGRHQRPGHIEQRRFQARHARRISRWRRAAAATAAAVLTATAVGAVAEAASSGYQAPCSNHTNACLQRRVAALESWAATFGAPSGAATVTVTRGLTSTVTVTGGGAATQTAGRTSTAQPSATAPSSRTPTPGRTTTSVTPTGRSTPSPTGSSSGPSSRPAGTAFLPYSDGSFFKSSVLGAPIDAAATAQFHAFMASHPDQAGTSYPVIRGVGGNQWGMVYAEGRASDPVWRLIGAVPAEVSLLSSVGFHAPDSFGSQLTGTSDSPFVVLDRASGFTVWGAKASKVGDHVVSVGAAGLFEHNSNGLDRRNPRSDSSVNFRSRGAIPDAMVIRHDLMESAMASGGDLGHVLHLFFVETDSSAGSVHPMVGAESGKNGWGAEGQRIAVRAGADLSGCSPEGAVIARTLQRHGAYLGDNAGGPTSLKAEQESPGHSVWGGALQADELNGCISWSDFVVLPRGYQ